MFVLQITTEFFSSQIGVALQIAAFIAVIFSSIKYLNKKFEERINQTVQNKIQPSVSSLCQQIDELEKFQTKTETAIRYIDKALMSIQSNHETDRIRQERGEQ